MIEMIPMIDPSFWETYYWYETEKHYYLYESLLTNHQLYIRILYSQY